MTDDQRCCRTCRWWDRGSPIGFIDAGNGICREEGSGTKHRLFLIDSVCLDSDNHITNAWLETAPDFGCVQWEEKGDSGETQ